MSGSSGRAIRCRFPGGNHCGFIEKRELQDGFSVYLTDFAPAAPIIMSSDSWPAGFSWVFFLSGQAIYNHKSLGRTIEMKSGMNRLAFQGGTCGFAQFYPGSPVRIVTLPCPV